MFLGFPVVHFLRNLQSPGIQSQNMRPNRLSHILKSSMNTLVFVNAIIGFSENLFLVNVQVVSGRYYCICIITSTVNRYEETLKLTTVSNIILI